MKFIKSFFIGLGAIAFTASLQAQAVVLDNTPDTVKTKLNALAESGISLFDVVVPVILAVVGLGVLLTMVKMIKKR